MIYLVSASLRVSALSIECAALEQAAGRQPMRSCVKNELMSPRNPQSMRHPAHVCYFDLLNGIKWEDWQRRIIGELDWLGKRLTHLGAEIEKQLSCRFDGTG